MYEPYMATLRIIHNLATVDADGLCTVKVADVKKACTLPVSTLGNHIRALRKEGYISRGALEAGMLYLTRRTLQELGKK